MAPKMALAGSRSGAGTASSSAAVRFLWRVQKPAGDHALSSPQSQQPPSGMRDT